MATFNTAFGALPSVKTLTGREPRRPKMRQAPDQQAQDGTEYGGSQQLQAQMSAQREAQQRQGGAGMGGTGGATFADLQKQGRARPAPSPFGAQTRAPGAPPPQGAELESLDARLRQALGQMRSAPPQMQEMQMTAGAQAAPAEAAPPAPAASQQAAPSAAPPSAPPPSAPPTGPLVDQVAGVLGPTTPSVSAEQPAGSEASADISPTSPTTYTVANPPTANAAEGTTFRDANGRVWTKRAGLWSAFAVAGQASPTGYGSLLPREIIALGQQGPYQVSGLEPFMRQFGRPETPEQYALLAANYRTSVDELRQLVRDRRIPSQQAVADQQQERQYQRERNLINPQTGFLRENIPNWVVFIPRSGGGPFYRAKTLEELKATPGAPEFTRNMTAEQYQQYLQTQPDFDGAKAKTGGTIPDYGDADVLGPVQLGIGSNRLPTQGAFTPPAPRNSFGATGAGINVPGTNAFLTRLMERLGLMMQGPSPEEAAAFEAQRKAGREDLEAKFKGDVQALNEEMAARGLFASTIGSGRMGDLSGQQARALSNLEADILKSMQEAQSKREALVIQGLQAGGATQAEIDTRAAQIQQEERLKGREMDIAEARLKAEVQIAAEDRDLRFAMAQLGQTGTRNDFILKIIEMIGAANIPPDVLAELVKTLGLPEGIFTRRTPQTPPTPGDPSAIPGPPTSGDPNNPSTWPSGARDGEQRRTADGRIFVWNATAAQWRQSAQA